MNKLSDLTFFLEDAKSQLSPADFLSLLANGATLQEALETKTFEVINGKNMKPCAHKFLQRCSDAVFVQAHNISEITLKKRHSNNWTLKEIAQNCSELALKELIQKNEVRAEIKRKKLLHFPLDKRIEAALIQQEKEEEARNFRDHVDNKIVFKSSKEFCDCLGISVATYTKKRKLLQVNTTLTNNIMVSMVIKIINKDFGTAGRPKNAKNYGEKGLIREIADKTGIPYSTIRYRHEKGLDLYSPNRGQNVEKVGSSPYSISGMEFSNRVQALDFFCRTHDSALKIGLAKGLSECDSINYYTRDKHQECLEQLYIICHSSHSESFIQVGIANGPLSDEVSAFKDNYDSATLLALPVNTKPQQSLSMLAEQFVKSTRNAYHTMPKHVHGSKNCYELNKSDLTDLVVFIGNSWSKLNNCEDAFQRPLGSTLTYVDKIVDQLKRISIKRHNDDNKFRKAQ